MPIVEAVQCPAGHAQTYARSDRLGRCTRCGSPLLRVPHDDALPLGLTERGGDFKPEEA